MLILMACKGCGGGEGQKEAALLRASHTGKPKKARSTRLPISACKCCSLLTDCRSLWKTWNKLALPVGCGGEERQEPAEAHHVTYMMPSITAAHGP